MREYERGGEWRRATGSGGSLGPPRSVDTDSVVRAAAGRGECELEVVGRHWALTLQPTGLVSQRFPRVSLYERGAGQRSRIDDLPCVLRCVPTRVGESASEWLPVLQALSEIIEVLGADPVGDAQLPWKLQAVPLDVLSWLGPFDRESDIPCEGSGRACSAAYSVELHDGRFLGVQLSDEHGRDVSVRSTGPVVRDGTDATIDPLRELRAEAKKPSSTSEARSALRLLPADRSELETLAHDLKNVLTVVTGHLELAERRGQPIPARALAASRKGVEIARRGLTGLDRNAPPTASPAKVIADVVSLVDGAFGGRVELVAALDAGIGPVQADARELHSALLNLVLNARDALSERGRIVVSARTCPRGGRLARPHVEITVADNGAGIPDEIGSRTLERFNTSKGAQGSGLGLSQVKRFVERFGGGVRIDRTEGGGTRVCMQLPIDSTPTELPDCMTRIVA